MQGYEYRMMRRTSASTYWICTQFGKNNKCKAKLVTTGNHIKMSYDEHHHQGTFKGDYSNLLSQRYDVEYCRILRL